jgi:putative hemolysin
MSNTEIISLIILLIFSGLFSGTETALMSINNIKVKSLVKQGKKGAKALEKIKSNPHKLIITILIGNNVVNIAAASLATVIFTDIFGSAAIGISTGIMTFLILIFGEITPKTYAAQNAEKVSLKVAKYIYWLSIVLTPIIWFFEGITKIMSKLLGSKGEQTLTEAELETIVSMGRKEGILEKEAADMMHNVLKFGQTTAEEIMTPRVDMVLINGDDKLEDVLDLIIKTPYSRYPVYVKNQDKIEGIIDIDDVLKQVKNKKLNAKIKTFLRPLLFVPETKEIDDLLTEFEGKEVPMAIVVDEYGDVQGLVTVEDILEEIVGDIFDKSKIKSLKFKPKQKTIHIDAKTSIDDINKSLKLGLKGEHFNTIAGFIVEKLGRVPRVGEKIKLKNANIEVTQATKQTVKKVRITKKE